MLPHRGEDSACPSTVKHGGTTNQQIKVLQPNKVLHMKKKDPIEHVSSQRRPGSRQFSTEEIKMTSEYVKKY